MQEICPKEAAKLKIYLKLHLYYCVMVKDDYQPKTPVFF